MIKEIKTLMLEYDYTFVHTIFSLLTSYNMLLKVASWEKGGKKELVHIRDWVGSDNRVPAVDWAVEMYRSLTRSRDSCFLLFTC